jgi:hypothetical protein
MFVQREGERHILEFLVLVYYLDAMLVCRLVAAVTANGGKMAIGRHGEDTPLGSYPRSQRAVTKANVVVPKIDEALNIEENAVARWPAECIPRQVVCSVIKEAQWTQQ